MNRKRNEKIMNKKSLLTLAMLSSLVFFPVSLAFAGYSVVELESTGEPDAQIHAEDRVDPQPLVVTHAEPEKAFAAELREVVVNLRGATDYETVEIFNRLLTRIRLIEGIDRIRLVIVPTRPGRCLATWKVLTRDKDTFAIESQLVEMIEGLDSQHSGDILDGLYFTADVDDVEQVKKISPRFATASALNFSLEPVQEFHHRSHHDKGLLYAGFD